MQWQNIVFVRGSKGTIVSLHGEGYTERDTAAKCHCSKTAVFNDIVKFTFHDRKRSVGPRKIKSGEDCSVTQLVMRFVTFHHHHVHYPVYMYIIIYVIYCIMLISCET